MEVIPVLLAHPPLQGLFMHVTGTSLILFLVVPNKRVLLEHTDTVPEKSSGVHFFLSFLARTRKNINRRYHRYPPPLTTLIILHLHLTPARSKHILLAYILTIPPRSKVSTEFQCVSARIADTSAPI